MWGKCNELISKTPMQLRLIILIAALGLIFLLWKTVFWQPLVNEEVGVGRNIKSLQTQVIKLQQTLAMMQEALSKKLTNAAQDKRVAVQAMPISPQKLSLTFKSLMDPKYNLRLVNLEAEPTKIVTDPITSRQLFTHSIVIKFIGDYVGTFAYIESLEQLHWPIYWDDFKYIVTKYPEAEVTLTIHTLSYQEDFDHEAKPNGLPLNDKVSAIKNNIKQPANK